MNPLDRNKPLNNKPYPNDLKALVVMAVISVAIAIIAVSCHYTIGNAAFTWTVDDLWLKVVLPLEIAAFMVVCAVLWKKRPCDALLAQNNAGFEPKSNLIDLLKSYHKTPPLNQHERGLILKLSKLDRPLSKDDIELLLHAGFTLEELAKAAGNN